MEQCEQCNLFSVIDNCRVRRYTGSVSIETGEQQVSLWLVRGNLVHALSSQGDVGWKALDGIKGVVVSTMQWSEEELPPERSIRIDTSRLLNAMKSTTHRPVRPSMYVPIPLHARLQHRFLELKRKVTGLKSFETTAEDSEKNESLRDDSSAEQETHGKAQARTILEMDPRGSKWTYRRDGRQLVVRGDESLTSSELMWVGAELWKEFDQMVSKSSENG